MQIGIDACSIDGWRISSMKRKVTVLSVGSLQCVRDSPLRPPVSRLSTFARHQSRNISENLPIKRRKFTKGAMELLTDLTASFSEKMMHMAAKVAQDKKNAEGTVDFDFSVLLTPADVSLAASYVVFPNVIDFLKTKRSKPICNLLLVDEGGEEFQAEGAGTMADVEEERNAKVRERGVNSLLLA